MKYYTTTTSDGDGLVIGLEEGKLSSFLHDDNNPDFLTYQAWLADGNTAEEWQPDTTTESVES